MAATLGAQHYMLPLPLQAAAAANLLPTPADALVLAHHPGLLAGAPMPQLLPAQVQQLQQLAEQQAAAQPPTALYSQLPPLYTGGGAGPPPVVYSSGAGALAGAASAAATGPVYVNERQLAGILRRRSKKQKREEENKRAGVRKVGQLRDLGPLLPGLTTWAHCWIPPCHLL